MLARIGLARNTTFADDFSPKGAATWEASRHGLASKEGRGEPLAARAAKGVAFQSAAF
ncbi:hypothetical protein IE4872_PD01866 (plasmid) [Rhizobium gallicum]|uniref:Uncharacterized protein n=1 Tax=Rhizobium gallicum TaxID=56730 RepID=A0A1L5NWT6_9HYPH|nr:hypothetical protein IE4872_PD01866 [Rhizobium gallicum]